MAILLNFKKVSLFEKEQFGICNISFEIERHRKYHLIANSEEQLNSLAGLIEGRYQKHSGHIERAPRLFIQSDRLLMGEKTYSQNAGKWLALQSEFFKFGNRTRSKYYFIQTLKAGHLVEYPIYKLKDDDRIKFALLALAFQESGIILISKLLTQTLNDELRGFLHQIIRDTNTTVCLLTCSKDWNLKGEQQQLPDLIRFDFSKRHD
ncbi:hypothetical protein KJ966_02925 [bacterium]|nr:hypothetical protein [bacterium]